MMTSLDKIVKTYILRRGETDMSNYDRYMAFAKSGVKKANILAIKGIKSRLLPVKNNMTADLPPDFQKYIKLGMIYKGMCLIIDLNESLCLDVREDTYCDANGNEITPAQRLGNDVLYLGSNEYPDYYTMGYDFYNFSRDGKSIGGLHGVGAGYHSSGLFRVNEETMQVQLNSDWPADAELVIEYKSNGLNDDGTLIPDSAEEPVFAYMDYKLNKSGTNKDDMVTEFRQLKSQNYGSTLHELVKASRRHHHLGVKR